MTCPRFEACRLLQRSGIDCAIWFEDALGHYGVPTVVFDFHVLVPDIEAAAEHLYQHGWYKSPPQPGDIFSFLNDSPTLKEPLTFLHLSPPGSDDETAIRTVLMPADAWNFTADQLARAAKGENAFYPPLPELLDSLIDGYLDSPDGSLEAHLATHVGYIYEYVAQVKDKSFGKQLKPEHRQFHLDAVDPDGTLPDRWTLPFRRHEREVRDAFLEDQRRGRGGDLALPDVSFSRGHVPEQEPVIMDVRKDSGQ